ncbi:hypothetical protein POM88_048823 [Heracleum sosnowskyi]|uniref:Uncharacterized protein n=1 Tax=Heracleum sosnowskyi TaxID=360622 RepID=A0AAD8GUH5_9APIA|nr:hypothetical protein POM88_048823 [Heracleum sosnowskyi]
MLMSSKPDFSHQNPLYEIKQDDKFFTKLVSKETSIANPSFRSGVSVAVPFVWETRPGTPRHKLFPDPDSLPPTLTPPPSYYFTPTPNHQNRATKRQYSKSKLLNFLLLRIIHFKKSTHQVTMSPSSPFSFSPSPSSSSSLSSYSSGNSSVPSKIGRGRRRRLLSLGSVFDDDDFQVSMQRSKSVLCFGS